MTIHGGNGGKKLTPPAIPASSTVAPNAPANASDGTERPASTPPVHADGFERGGDARATPSAWVSPFTSESPTTLDQVVRLLEETRAQILEEHHQLREQASVLVAELVEGEFEFHLLEQKRTRLAELRERISAMRKRLQHIQRRLKSAMGKSTKAADLDVAKSMQQQLDKLKSLEPGMHRALVALSMLEHACAGTADGASHTPTGTASADDRGRAIADVAPASIAARAAAAMLSETSTPPPVVEAATHNVEGMNSLRELAETVLAAL